ncbi:uncharacterized protein ATNIH1004_006731 [Aspergillus tanneri]|nr:uncharacterized protein ATNIH1004_006731 [Aspergillus tanneri]KAA8645312.1 hypothetical protein ATNIH1004_006731 [Aspergillus tanneri]
MGLARILLKAIIIPVVLIILLGALIWFLVKRHREKKREKALEGQHFQHFQAPPITQWATGPHPTSPAPMLKPEPIYYPMQQPLDPRGQ